MIVSSSSHRVLLEDVILSILCTTDKSISPLFLIIDDFLITRVVFVALYRVGHTFEARKRLKAQKQSCSMSIYVFDGIGFSTNLMGLEAEDYRTRVQFQD